MLTLSGNEKDLWRVNIRLSDGIEASDEDVEFSRTCMNPYVGCWTTGGRKKKKKIT